MESVTATWRLRLGTRPLAVARKQVIVAGERIRYEVAGTGDPVVLVHGLSGSGQWWSRNVPALAKHYRVFLVDLPGFGSMRRPFHPFPLPEVASWLMAWMEGVGLDEVHLVGHSMGGYVSVRVAASAPEVVRSLTLVAPAGVRMRQSQLRYLIPLLRALRNTTLPFLPMLVHDSLRAGPLTLMKATRELLAEDVLEQLASVVAPTLLVFGERDTLVPPSLGPVMREMIPDSQLLVLRKGGHVPMFDRSREFNAAILRFLQGKKVEG